MSPRFIIDEELPLDYPLVATRPMVQLFDRTLEAKTLHFTQPHEAHQFICRMGGRIIPYRLTKQSISTIEIPGGADLDLPALCELSGQPRDTRCMYVFRFIDLRELELKNA